MPVETVAAVAEPFGRFVNAAGWTFQASPSGARKWMAPRAVLAPYRGLGSFVSYVTPKGESRVRIEGNLTSGLYGRDLKWASLHPDDLDRAIARMIAEARDLVPALPEHPSAWTVRRYDPSATLDVGERAAEVIGGAHASWMQRVGPRGESVEMHNGQTTTLHLTKRRTWSIYDKHRESLSHALPCPRGMVRVEARRLVTGTALTLSDLGERVVDEREIDEAIESMTAITAESIKQMVIHLQAGGASQAESLRLAAAALLLQQGGTETLREVGLSKETARRTRHRVQEVLHAAGDVPEPDADGVEPDGLVETTAQVLQHAEPVYARDVAAS